MSLKSVKGLKAGAVLGLSLTLASCAVPGNKDPYEDFNRDIYGFNKTIDDAVIRPVAYAYDRATPSAVKSLIGNFFDNFRQVTTVANDLLQLKWGHFANDLSRLTINTTVGLLGFLDPATVMGLEKRREDFGQTLYRWGIKESPYLVLPLLGPSTIRDTAGLLVDYYALSVWPWIDDDRTRYTLLGLDLIDIRARMIRHEKVVDALAYDEYTLIRNAYLQRRDYLGSDGASSMDDLDIDFMDEENDEVRKEVSGEKKI